MLFRARMTDTDVPCGHRGAGGVGKMRQGRNLYTDSTTALLHTKRLSLENREESRRSLPVRVSR
jgi:hypothetical protein